MIPLPRARVMADDHMRRVYALLERGDRERLDLFMTRPISGPSSRDALYDMFRMRDLFALGGIRTAIYFKEPTCQATSS